MDLAAGGWRGTDIVLTAQIETVGSVGSTNADLLARAPEDMREGYWLRAEQQERGRGRTQRDWFSPTGNLYCSTYVLTGNVPEPPVPTLGFVAGMALHDAVSEWLGISVAQLKWPNDLMVGDAKLAGILLERVRDVVVIGIGVNVQVAPQVEGRKTICCADLPGGKAMTAGTLLESLAEHFAERLECWRETPLWRLLQEWETRAHKPGTPMSVGLADDERIQGYFAGLENDGALRLKKANGETIAIHAGDVELVADARK